MKPLNVVFICVTLLIAGTVFYPTLYRYDKITEEKRLGGGVGFEEETLIRVNRLTGYTEIFKDEKWRSVEKEEEKEQNRMEKLILKGSSTTVSENPAALMPKEASAKLEVDLVLASGVHKIHGEIYNGSDWCVETVYFRVVAKRKDGSVKWDRWVEESFSSCLMPLETKVINLSLVARNVHSFDWEIVGTYGYK